MDKFKHVVGIIHTNYLSYTRADSLGQIKEPLVYYINQGTHTQTICFVSARATFLLFHNPITSIWQHTTHIYYLQGYAVRIATKSSNYLVRCRNLLLRKKWFAMFMVRLLVESLLKDKKRCHLNATQPKNSQSQACAPSIWILATTPVPPRSPKERILWAKWPGPRDLGNSLRSWITWNNGERLSCCHFFFLV